MSEYSDTWAARQIIALANSTPHGHHEGTCTDCGRVLSEPQGTFFGTMCLICKNNLFTTERHENG